MSSNYEQPVAAVILAAGASSRMGRPKQLLDWNGKALVRVVAEHALAAGFDPIVVVLGAHTAQVREALAGLPLQCVSNSDYHQGQSTSLRAGVAALPTHIAAALVLLGDQPFVTPAIMRVLVQRWHEEHSQIVVPLYQGQRGNPVLFGRAVFAELMAVSGDQGARALIQSNPARVTHVHFEDTRPLEDIDTIEDYTRLTGKPF
jgi:molybdenum cofactor cytidylyltransferase